MLKNIFTTLVGLVNITLGIAFIALVVVGGKFAYDVYNEIDYQRTPVGQVVRPFSDIAEEAGIIKRSSYSKAVIKTADLISK